MNVHGSLTAPTELVLPTERGLFYGGAWHRAQTGGEVNVHSPATGETLCRIAEAGRDDVEAAIAAAAAGFGEWRRVPPLERARILRAAADILRQHGRELAMLDAADGGNPVTEMQGDVNIAAGQMEFFAGLVTEMKGASVPMGPDRLNFSVREPRGVVGADHPVQPSVHVLRRQVGGAARRRQRRHRQAARAGAAVRAAAGRADRRAVPARRVQRRPRRARGWRDLASHPGMPWWR